MVAFSLVLIEQLLQFQTLPPAPRQEEREKTKIYPLDAVPQKELSQRPPLLFISHWPQYVRMSSPRSAWKCITTENTIKVLLLKLKRRDSVVWQQYCIFWKNTVWASFRIISRGSLWVVNVLKFFRSWQFFFKCSLNDPCFLVYLGTLISLSLDIPVSQSLSGTFALLSFGYGESYLGFDSPFIFQLTNSLFHCLITVCWF